MDIKPCPICKKEPNQREGTFRRLKTFTLGHQCKGFNLWYYCSHATPERFTYIQQRSIELWNALVDTYAKV